MSDPAVRKRISEANRGRKVSESCKQKLRDYGNLPEVKAARSALIKGDRNPSKRPDVRAKLSAATKKRNRSEKDIEQIRKMAREAHTPKWCENQSKAMRGENNPRWRGGISFEPYCPKFTNSLKEYIRQKFNHQCFRCGSDGGDRKLDVHHVDYNKLQGCKGMTWALIPLCQVCHAWTTNHRHDAFNTLINYWVMNSEINFHANEELR